VNVLRRTNNLLISLVRVVWNAFDIRDIFVFGGIAMLGYGLYLHYGQWLAFSVVGVLLMLLGLGFLTKPALEKAIPTGRRSP